MGSREESGARSPAGCRGSTRRRRAGRFPRYVPRSCSLQAETPPASMACRSWVCPLHTYPGSRPPTSGARARQRRTDQSLRKDWRHWRRCQPEEGPGVVVEDPPVDVQRAGRGPRAPPAPRRTGTEGSGSRCRRGCGPHIGPGRRRARPRGRSPCTAATPGSVAIVVSRWRCGKRSRSWNASAGLERAHVADRRPERREPLEHPLEAREARELVGVGARPHVDHEHAVPRDQPLVDGQHPRIVRVEPLDLGVDLQARQPPRLRTPRPRPPPGRRPPRGRCRAGSRRETGSRRRGSSDSAPGTSPAGGRTRRTRSARRRPRGGRPPRRPARWGR